jgi:Ca-activated chloride channel family protein
MGGAMSDWQFLTEFHFIRPLWLLGIIPALLCFGIVKKINQHSGNWEKVINPALLPYLMQNSLDTNNYAKYFQRSLALCWLLFCLSLAGPSWNQLPQPVHKEDSALVVIFDLSPSMLAEDIAPSRLVRARYKMIDIFKARKQGLSALVVYAGEAFTVSPLTEDSNTIVSLAPTLNPTLLPNYGSNTEDAIATALELVTNGGFQQADLLLITDGVDRSAFGDISSQLSRENIRLHILGVGTPQGAPIPMGNGGFVKDQNDSIILPRLDSASLKRLANIGNGRYFSITNNDSDIVAITEAMEQEFPNTSVINDRSFDIWQDRGFWVVFLLLPLLLASFRKGAVYVVILAPSLMLTEPTEASVWQDLWYTSDQQGRNALEDGDAEMAQSLFKHPQWQASAAYKNGDYASAADQFKQGNSAVDYYNLGNSLAHMGELDKAIAAYDQALKILPDMQDAIANKKLIEQLKQQQQNQPQDGESQDSQENQSQNGQSQDNQSQDSQSQDSQSQDSQSQDSQSQDSQSQDSQSQDNESQRGEQQQSKQEQAEQQDKSETQQQQDSDQQQDEETAKQQLSEMQKTEQQKLEEQQQQELQQWLRRVPDDPGGLLRQKFRHQSQQRASEQRRPPPPNQQERW